MGVPPPPHLLNTKYTVNLLDIKIDIKISHRVEVVPTEEKIHQVLKLTTDIQWLKIHGGS